MYEMVREFGQESPGCRDSAIQRFRGRGRGRSKPRKVAQSAVRATAKTGSQASRSKIRDLAATFTSAPGVGGINAPITFGKPSTSPSAAAPTTPPAGPDATSLIACPFAFAVDRMLGQQEVVVRPLEDPLVRVPGVSGSTDLGDGKPTLVLDLVALSSMLSEAAA